jgi:hypothetical protein
MPISRKAASSSNGRSSQNRKPGRASLLPAEFHRPSDEFPEFAAPEGMPPTYHDLPNIDVLRKDLSVSLAKIGSSSSEPMSQLYLADAPGSPLVFEPPVLPNLLPFPSAAGPRYGESDDFNDESIRGLDWTRPGSLLGMSAIETLQDHQRLDGGSAIHFEDTKDSEALLTEQLTSIVHLDKPQSIVPVKAGPNFALAVRPVTAPAVEVDADDGNYLSINDLLPYDKAITPVNKWLRYSFNLFLIGLSISIVTGTANYMHLRPTNFLGMAMVALTPVRLHSSSAMPMASAGDVVVDNDGDFVKTVKVVDHSVVKGLNPSVFSQLSSGNSTVGVISVAPANVGVLPVDGTPDPDRDSNSQQADTDNDVDGQELPKAFSQASFPIVKFKFHHHVHKLRF